MKLVDVKKLNPNIVLDIRYSTKNNFTGEVLYEDDSCYLVGEVAQKICKVQEELEKIHLKLVIWDAFRPVSVQEKLKKVCTDTNFVADISNHSRGIAVDVTLSNSNGELLEMPTDFDDFSQKAHSSYNDLTENILKNREILRRIMEKNGFIQNEFEWWHFDYKPLLDSPIIANYKD